MAFAYLNMRRSQEELGRALKVRPGFGAPASNIRNLRSRQIEASYHLSGTLDDLRS